MYDAKKDSEDDLAIENPPHENSGSNMNRWGNTVKEMAGREMVRNCELYWKGANWDMR